MSHDLVARALLYLFQHSNGANGTEPLQATVTTVVKRAQADTRMYARTCKDGTFEVDERTRNRNRMSNLRVVTTPSPNSGGEAV